MTEPIWRTNDGRLISVAQLEDEHLDNILCMYERKRLRNVPIETDTNKHPVCEYMTDSKSSDLLEELTAWELILLKEKVRREKAKRHG